MDTPAMIAVEALGDIPAFIQGEFGDRALERCIQDSGISEKLLSDPGAYIPEIAINRFFDTAARISGDSCFGACIASRLSVRDYGVFGDYVLEAPTLGAALEKCVSIIHLHANKDELSVSTGPGSTHFRYSFAERRASGYRQVALAAVGALLSIPRHYLGANWKPVSVGLDLPLTLSKASIESSFQCDVHLGRPCIEVEIDNRDLATTNTDEADTLTTTIFDVHRACSGGPPEGFAEIVATLLRQNLGMERSSLEDIARGLGMGPRMVQRRLDMDGTSFRRISGRVKIARGIELLCASHLSVSEIAFELDYSTSSHFSRAFRRRLGVSPDQYRTMKRELL